MQQYLQRIGYSGDGQCNPANLSRLLRAHLETVPFENLDFYHNPCQLPLDQDALYDKVVIRRRGGVCFELNSSFGWLLRQMGYETYPVLVRILIMGAGGPSPLSHMGNVVTLEGKRYYCDVGFGGPGPKGLVCLDDAEVQVINGESYRTEWRGIDCYIHKLTPDGWVPCLRTIHMDCNVMDFTILLYYFTSNPSSHFVNARVVNLCQPDGYLALSDNLFSGKRNGVSFHREVPEEEIPALLASEFGLVL